ncbi:16S rRNA (guanine(966)-N(2))-methyltransferase RsmD [Vogesella sp. DC21W]|uniref:16S rRNA (Guanine(966)-N(2))-methyltransferase RsmD n=1 Tax=Vogesella aquatica TaxID=2984206 RepID=A0ABT5IV09_9NEIS|nr:16S rRNA (guanine(966)-N(2))-methyltransferase RsmD [Vogesella aquatica]MDC7716408.1 16S rRNA (guanine(966)-N(2))-methyltransferase RsmD [Vogesella aquatica]
MTQQRNKVRIIGGKYRRRLLDVPEAEGLRPTPDRVRETLFNWLGQELYGKRCLDLFAGSGALGFEAASREALRVLLVEKMRPVAAVLQKNKQLLAATEIEILVQDALTYLKNCREQFDVIFVDPPYQSALLEQVLPQLAAILAPGGKLYIETPQHCDFPGWQVERSLRAGKVHSWLLCAESHE